jgi:hypothetical protein
VSSHGESPEASASAGTGKPDLRESLRQFGAAGRSTASAANDALKALRILVSADISLARSALGRALACRCC